MVVVYIYIFTVLEKKCKKTLKNKSPHAHLPLAVREVAHYIAGSLWRTVLFTRKRMGVKKTKEVQIF